MRVFFLFTSLLIIWDYIILTKASQRSTAGSLTFNKQCKFGLVDKSFSYNESGTSHFYGSHCLRDAYHALLNTATLRTLSFLEEAKGAKSYNNYHSYGTYICY